MLTQFDGFHALQLSIDERFPDAKYGNTKSVSDTGEEYVEISFSALSRPVASDMAVVSRFVVSQFSRLLTTYLDQTHGRVYWRIPLEYDTINDPQVVRYLANGPDVDFYTDKRCILDREWKCLGVYCRLLRSDKPVKEFA
jgi:hypothetical protein